MEENYAAVILVNKYDVKSEFVKSQSSDATVVILTFYKLGGKIVSDGFSYKPVFLHLIIFLQ